MFGFFLPDTCKTPAGNKSHYRTVVVENVAPTSPVMHKTQMAKVALSTLFFSDDNKAPLPFFLGGGGILDVPA